jgi:Protein of unknown function (DUF3667)
LVDAERNERRVTVTSSVSSAAALTCRNCGHDYSTTPAAKYCPECGQETDPSPPTFREFVHHFFGNYIAVKGSLPQTLWRLISRPGALTRDYLDGRKRAYMLPLRLYLTVSVVCFLIFGILVNLGTATVDSTTKSEDSKNAAVLNFGDSSYVKFENNTATCKDVPDWLCERAKTKFATPEARKALATSLPDRMLRYWAYAMFALVPLFAALMKLVYVRRKMTYGAHVVFALHMHTFWLLVLLLATAHDLFSIIATVAIPVYALLAMRRVYGGGWIKTIAKAAFVSLAYLLVALIAVGIVAMVALLF